jgi:hypothetical protein
MHEVLESNGKKDIPPKDYSRFFRFLFLARKALQCLLVKHSMNQQIDLEDLFITSIVHLTDHLFLEKKTFQSQLCDPAQRGKVKPDSRALLFTPFQLLQ